MLNFDRTMPRSLKLHLIDIESNLISKDLLADEIVLDNISALVHGSLSKDEHQYVFIERVLKRLLHQTAFLIRQLGTSLKL